jgi:hypothetical protein
LILANAVLLIANDIRSEYIAQLECERLSSYAYVDFSLTNHVAATRVQDSSAPSATSK